MNHVQFGSLIETNKFTLFVGAILDYMDVDDTTIAGKLTAAPIYNEMHDLKMCDSFDMNRRKYSIMGIF